MRKQIYQCAQYKLKIVYKTLEQKESEKHAFLQKIISLKGREDLSNDLSSTAVGLI